MFLTFYGGAIAAVDGHALGPFDDLVVRAAHVVGGPYGAERVIAFRGSDGRWLDAERTTDAPQMPYSHLRLHSSDHDLMVRFFAEDKNDASPTTQTETGPYFAVSVGPRDLRGDGELIADRVSPDAPWLAVHASGKRQALAGAVLAVRSGSAERVAPSAPVAAPTAPEIATPRPSFGPAFKFVERARIEPKIYRARGTAAERDP